MDNYNINDKIEFLTLIDNESILPLKIYIIQNIDNYKRKNNYMVYLTIKDDKGNDYKFKLSEEIKIKKKEFHWLEIEYEISKLIENCIVQQYDLENNIKELLTKFSDIRKTSKNTIFKKLVEIINKKDSNEKDIMVAINRLQTFIENEAEKIGLQLDGIINEPEIEFKNEVDNTDYEKIVMQSFRNGEQDRFGY